MSSETENFSTAVAQEFVSDAKSQIEAAREGEARQSDLFGAPSPEAMLEAREVLGPNAGALAVASEARRRGRKPGSRNKASQEFKRWILSYGQHPAVTLMQIQSTPEEVLIERSKLAGDGKRKMTVHEASSLRVRCAEALMPFLESKQPVAVDMSFSGLSHLVMAGFTHTQDEVQDIINAKFLPVEDDDGADDGEWGAGE